jgi:hypothetical protein
MLGLLGVRTTFDVAALAKVVVGAAAVVGAAVVVGDPHVGGATN